MHSGNRSRGRAFLVHPETESSFPCTSSKSTEIILMLLKLTVRLTSGMHNMLQELLLKMKIYYAQTVSILSGSHADGPT